MTRRRISIAFDATSVLARIRVKPIHRDDLAGTKNPTARRQLRVVLDGLLESGSVKVVRLDGRRLLAAASWTPTKEMQLAEIYGRCRAEDGCMLWTGRIDKARGPTIYAPLAGTERSVRRRIWGIHRRKLDRSTTIAMNCAYPEDCVLFEHMERSSAGAKMKGKPKTLLHRIAIATAKRLTVGKLSEEKVERILQGEGSTRSVARELDVSQAIVQAVRAGDRWRNYRATPFSGLEAINDSGRRRA